MIQKIKDLLYRGVHASGCLFHLKLEVGSLYSSLWVGRENPDVVCFDLNVGLNYGPDFGPSLRISIELGVIKIELFLINHLSE